MTETRHDSVAKDTLHGIALTALICAVAVSIPIIGFFALLLLPQPVIFYRLKLGRKKGLVIIGATLLLILLIIGRLFADGIFLIGMLGLGFFMGEFIERRFRVEEIVAYASGAVLLTGLLALAFYASWLDISIKALVSDYIEKNLQMTIALYEKTGMSKTSRQMLENSITPITNALIRLLPSLAAAGLLFAGWLNLLAIRRLLNQWQTRLADFGRLNLWKAPEWLVWGVIGAIALILVPADTARLLGANALVVLMLVYFFQGIAVVSYYLDQKKVPWVFRYMIYAFIAIQQIVMLIVIAIGFCDVWANFRRLENPPDAP